MTVMETIRNRAEVLRPLPGMTPLRLFWMLRREFRGTERDFLVIAAKLDGAPRGIAPEGGRLHPVVARWQRKTRPIPPVIKSERTPISMDYPLMTVEARDLRSHDWIDEHGAIEELGVYSTMVYVKFVSGDGTFYNPLDPVVVRIEDEGKESPKKGV